MALKAAISLLRVRKRCLTMQPFMKTPFCLFLAVGLAVLARAQAPATEYSPDQLDQMLGPIALYPDPLIALILPASTPPPRSTWRAAATRPGSTPSRGPRASRASPTTPTS